MAAKPPAQANLGELVAQMQHLKEEHRQLATVIGADAGMSPATRKALLDHLVEEEDELAAKIAAAEPASTTRSSELPRLTVGSLRPDASENSRTLGSLRRR